MMKHLQKLLSLTNVVLSATLFVTGTTFAQDNQADKTSSAEPIFEVIASFDQTAVNDLEVSPDGSMLAVATTTGIWIYNTVDLTLQSSLVVSEQTEVTTISWSSVGPVLAAGYEDGVRIWNVEKRAVSWSYHKIPDVTHIAWNPFDYKLELAVLNTGYVEEGMTSTIFTDLRIVIPYVDEHVVIMRKTDLQGNTNQAIWSPEGTQLLYLDQVSGFIFSDIMCETMVVHPYLWSEEGIQTDNTPLIQEDPFALTEVAWSPDGAYIAMSIEDNCTTMSELQIRDVSGTLIKTLPAGSMPAWSADEAVFATFTQETLGEYGFLIWDGAFENSRFVRSGNVKQFVISPDGMRLYANHWGEIAVYNIQS